MHAHTYIQYIYCDAKQADAQNPHANSAPPPPFPPSHTGGLAIMQLKLAPLDISHIAPPPPPPPTAVRPYIIYGIPNTLYVYFFVY